MNMTTYPYAFVEGVEKNEDALSCSPCKARARPEEREKSATAERYRAVRYNTLSTMPGAFLIFREVFPAKNRSLSEYSYFVALSLMIPEGFITNLLDRADIVDVIGRYVPLKKAGRNMMACCPFHKEKTPSFSVSPTKQFFKCFGCGESGNAIGFLMKYEGLEFPEAVRRLAGFYGMEVPEDRSPRQQKAKEQAKTLTDYMGEAAVFYREQLKQNRRAVDYLKARQITGETAAKFGLGYSPDEWHALETLFGEKYATQSLVDCGLVNVKNDRRYDAFRGRLMFPIRNSKGSVIGFGARTMNGDEQPKYLNSPETPIYHKGSELYGLWEGREAVRSKGRAIVCEGYMDVIQLSQAGFEESVAALGTSITPEHVRKLFKLTDNVYFSFDGDGAGRKAARRALEATLAVVTDAQKAGFILLPPEHDPDSLIKSRGASGFEEEIQKAYSLTDFMKRCLLEGKELMYAEERAKVVHEARPWILAMQHAPILRLTMVKELAGIARLQTEDILRQFGMAVSQTVQPVSGNGSDKPFDFSGRTWGRRNDQVRNVYWARRGWGRPHPEPRVQVKDVRERLLQCFLCYPALLSRFSSSIEEEFLTSGNPFAQQIIEVWRASAGEAEERLNPASLLMRLTDSENLNVYQTLLSEELSTGTPEEGAAMEVKKAFLDLELERIKTRLEMLGHDGCRDWTLLKGLNERRTELQKMLEEAAENERNYRQRLDMQLRTERETDVTPATSQLSSNPIVASLQAHLFGLSSEEDSEHSSSSETSSEAPVTPASPGRNAMLTEAIAIAAGDGGDRTLESEAPVDPDVFAQEVETLPDLPEGWDDVPDDDDVPCAFYEEMADAELNTGL